MTDIHVQPTPNPNALKFILDTDVKANGKTSFKNPRQAKDVPLAAALFDLRGVDQVHFFQNVITVSKFIMIICISTGVAPDSYVGKIYPLSAVPGSKHNANNQSIPSPL